MLPSKLSSSTITFMATDNLMTGLVPTKFGGLSNLEELATSVNYLTCTLPTELGFLTELDYIVMSTNFLTGVFVSEFGNWKKISIFEFANNLLTGSLPTELSSLELLEEFSVEVNSLTGTIPERMFAPKSLTVANMYGNIFTGSLPLNFSNSLETMLIHDNFFIGPLPSSLFELSNLKNCDLNNNWFSGSVLSSVELLKSLEYVDISFNYLTSSAPLLLGPVVEDLLMDNNFFSGSLPANISQNQRLEELTLNSNFISGTIPFQWENFMRLTVLNLSTNFMDGQITELFSNGSYKTLSALDLSQNAFSGSLPSSLFRSIQSLQEVVLHNNCFDGTIPESICLSNSLRTIILDGASSAVSCRESFGPLLSKVLKVVIGLFSIHGTIPSCIWQMPNLQTLHMAGNNLQGTLGDLSPDTVLNDISIDNNRLVGRLPLSWQIYGNFSQLSLSSNKLDGTLTSEFVVSSHQSNLDLSVNRFSGYIPSSFRDAVGINILSGNEFQCDGGSIPTTDPEASTYVCGADDFNVSILVWTVLLLLCSSGCYILLKENESSSIEVKKNDGSFICLLLLRSHKFVIVVETLTTLFVVLCIPSFTIFKEIPAVASYYSTHAVQYTWIVTAAYLHGIVPMVFVIVVLLLSVAVTNLILAHSPQSGDKGGELQKSWSAVQVWLVDICTTKSLFVASVVIVHLVATITVNAAYVLALLSGLSSSALLVVQAGLSAFKLMWNGCYVTFAVRKSELSRENSYVCSTFMNLFTFLGGPLIAVMFSDTSCFRYVISDQPPVVSGFVSGDVACGYICDFGVCEEFCTFDPSALNSSTSVQPAWQYSYECSSSLIIDYIPVLFFALTLSGIVVPSVHLLCAFRYVTVINADEIFSLSCLLLPARLRDTVSLISTPTVNKYEEIWITQVINKLTRNLAVSFTFGFACPLLMVAVTMDTLSVIACNFFLSRRHRYLICSEERTVPSKIADTGLEISAALTPHNFPSAGINMTVAVAAGFWSFFVFDMMGDVYGFKVGALCAFATCISVFFIHLATTSGLLKCCRTSVQLPPKGEIWSETELVQTFNGNFRSGLSSEKL